MYSEMMKRLAEKEDKSCVVDFFTLNYFFHISFECEDKLCIVRKTNKCWCLIVTNKECLI